MGARQATWSEGVKSMTSQPVQLSIEAEERCRHASHEFLE